MKPMFIDTYEPPSVEEGLNQSIEVIRFPLNSKGLLDYWWKVDGRAITIERKEIKDFMGSLDDGSLVDRLRLAIENKAADEIALLIEGVYTPYGTGTQVWKLSNNNKFYFRYRVYAKCSYNRIQSVLYSLDKAGCTIYHSSGLEGTANLLVALYKGSHAPESKLLDKYYKPKPVVKKRDVFVEQIMSVPGIGEDKAKELIAVCGTPFDIYNMDIEDLAHVAGIGHRIAEQILRTVGRLE